MNQGKLPSDWTVFFDKDNIYDFYLNMFKTVSKSFKNSLKNDEEMTLDANIGN